MHMEKESPDQVVVSAFVVRLGPKKHSSFGSPEVDRSREGPINSFGKFTVISSNVCNHRPERHHTIPNNRKHYNAVPDIVAFVLENHNKATAY